MNASFLRMGWSILSSRRGFWLGALALIAIPLTLLYLRGPSSATDSEYQVASIHDGDTLRVTRQDEATQIRLYCIDAPELAQAPWGQESRDALRAITPHRVRIRAHEKGRYGRLVAEVFDGDQSINLAMVRRGQAAVFLRYCKDPDYLAAERAVRHQRVGIWEKEGDQQAPWEFRAKRREHKPL